MEHGIQGEAPQEYLREHRFISGSSKKLPGFWDTQDEFNQREFFIARAKRGSHLPVPLSLRTTEAPGHLCARQVCLVLVSLGPSEPTRVTRLFVTSATSTSSFLLVWGHPGSAQSLFLIQCSGVTSGGAGRPRDQTLMQSLCLTICILSGPLPSTS